jgi:hypothetical protein
MAEVTNRAGLGQDGYMQYQAETTWGTPVSTSLIDLPAKEGSLIKAYVEDIETKNIIGDRTGQPPEKGRIIVEGQLVMDMWPTLLGGLLKQFLGAPTAEAVQDAFTNTWFIPKTGYNVGKHQTFVQAIGGNLADKFTSCVFDSVTINQDSQGNGEITFAIRGQTYTENVTRATTWTFPVSGTNSPFMFGHASISATPAGGSPVTLCAESFSVTINLNHQLDRYKTCSTASGAKILQPVFNSIPSIEMSFSGVDADQYFIEYARSRTQWDITLDWTHTVSKAGTTPTATYHQFAIEVPGCLLASDTEISNSNDYLNMDLTFNGSLGGTTTGSAASAVMAEIRLTQATSLA